MPAHPGLALQTRAEMERGLGRLAGIHDFLIQGWREFMKQTLCHTSIFLKNNILQIFPSILVSCLYRWR
jgi:hypothetical protein